MSCSDELSMNFLLHRQSSTRKLDVQFMSPPSLKKKYLCPVSASHSIVNRKLNYLRINYKYEKYQTLH